MDLSGSERPPRLFDHLVSLGFLLHSRSSQTWACFPIYIEGFQNSRLTLHEDMSFFRDMKM
jgi:hypothetical protein